MSNSEKVLDLIAAAKELRGNGAPDEVVAEFVATEVHKGGLDKSGSPYINHPTRVSQLVSALFTEHNQLEADAYVVAWLHDVIEDSLDHFGAQVTKSDLFLMFFRNEVLDAVELLTKRSGVSEEEYLSGIASNEIARIVKFADLTDNTSPLRRSGLNEQRKAKYLRYWQTLVLEDPLAPASDLK
jgi:(p)ppGpp synthase/HD superfamily hydrolase